MPNQQITILDAVGATGRSDQILVTDKASFSIVISNTATVQVEKSVDGSNRTVLATTSASRDYFTDEPGFYTFNVSAYTSGTVTVKAII